MSPADPRKAALKVIARHLADVRRPKLYDRHEYGYCGGLINMAFVAGAIEWYEASRLGELLTNASHHAELEYRAAQEATHAA
tara:strand:+ start:39417 stop:39662 length:246 start_codon:yes stop_codon:yes gene_type:complete